MNRLLSAGTAAAFGAAAAFSMLVFAAQHPATASHQIFFSGASSVALADRENHGNRGNHEDNEDQNHRNHGNKHCVNPAGNVRGWCKHRGDHEDRGHRHNHGTIISGTVISVNGNAAQFRLDNGQIIMIDDHGTALTPGQHYELRGNYNNGVFVVSGNGNNGQNGGGYNTSVTGTIVSSSGSTVTIAQGLTNFATINVQQAIDRNATNGSLNVGRHITAYGYTYNGMFYATSIQ
ncbi:MAG: hypothetical protein NVS1B14_09540 [Vulcanimicrobiaceae bacterium]